MQCYRQFDAQCEINKNFDIYIYIHAYTRIPYIKEQSAGK